jgi:MoxR-like ATPase
LALYRTVQAVAAVRGRNYAIPEDIKEMALPVLAHRLAPSIDARLHGQSTQQVLMNLLNEIPVPVEENWAHRS